MGVERPEVVRDRLAVLPGAVVQVADVDVRLMQAGLELERGEGNGVIFNDPDANGLRWGLDAAIHAVAEARTNPDRWNEHLKQMMADVRERFSVDRYVDELIAAYNRVAIERGLYEDGYVLL